MHVAWHGVRYQDCNSVVKYHISRNLTQATFVFTNWIFWKNFLGRSKCQVSSAVFHKVTHVPTLSDAIPKAGQDCSCGWIFLISTAARASWWNKSSQHFSIMGYYRGQDFPKLCFSCWMAFGVEWYQRTCRGDPPGSGSSKSKFGQSSGRLLWILVQKQLNLWVQQCLSDHFHIQSEFQIEKQRNLCNKSHSLFEQKWYAMCNSDLYWYISQILIIQCVFIWIYRFIWLTIFWQKE